MKKWKSCFLIGSIATALAGNLSHAGRMWAVSPEYFIDLSSFSVGNEIYYEMSNGFEPDQTFYLTFRLPPGHTFDTALFTHRISLIPDDLMSTAGVGTTITFEDGGLLQQFVQFKVVVGPSALDQIYPGDRFKFDLAAGALTKVKGPFDNARLKMTATVTNDAANADLVEANSALFACLNGSLPDASISGKGSGAGTKGKGVINKSGRGQTIKTPSRKNKTSLKISVLNDGGRSGRIKLRVTPTLSRGGIRSKAFLSNGSRRKNVTAAVKRGNLKPQVQVEKRMQVFLKFQYIPLTTAAPRVFRRTIIIRAQSGKNSEYKGVDVNKAKLRLRRR